MKYGLLPFWALMVLGLIGCAGMSSQKSTPTTIPITVLLEADQSQFQDILPSAIWVPKAGQLDFALAQQIKAAHPDAIPWDSGVLGVLVIHMGRQSTGGYGLSLAVPTMEVRLGRGIVNVTRHRPDIGAVVSQVITSPCLVLQFPYKDLKLLRVHDQDGRLLAEAAVR